MQINKSRIENTITLALVGRLDTVTQAELAKELEAVFANENVNLVFDFAALTYISSAGLRVLLAAQKKVNVLGMTMKIVGANPEVKEIFEVTGFAGIMTIE
ncbi:MAG TPA: STAS domain-containing protein [Bacillota bacterium]|nr:STAS domain-containing protein [Bacillota bacterium]